MAGAVSPIVHSDPLRPASASKEREGPDTRKARARPVRVSRPLTLEPHGGAAKRGDQ